MVLLRKGENPSEVLKLLNETDRISTGACCRRCLPSTFFTTAKHCQPDDATVMENLVVGMLLVTSFFQYSFGLGTTIIVAIIIPGAAFAFICMKIKGVATCFHRALTSVSSIDGRSHG